jgi:hypothetical protein
MKCKNILVTKAEREHVRRNARFQQHRDGAFIKLFPARQDAEGNSRQNLWNHSPSYATVKNWVTLMKRGNFSTCDKPRFGRTKTVTTTAIIDQIHELILVDRRISSKSIAE